ncbi:alpha/beta hydrolase [Candidatus Gracilibacteria bacterium]|nr:alpha/beta hydrolase [Candidatus Gracilibacteria bacterium]
MIVWFHGNAGRACDRQKIAGILEKTGYSYILVEYTGYAEGNSDIEPDIESILDNVSDISDYVKDEGYEKVISAGRSIGTGPASLLAGKVNSDKLFLFSPYGELYKVAEDKYPIFPIKYLFTQKYNSVEYLKGYKGEVLIIHGDNDRVIPNKFGKKLFDSLITDNKEFIDIEGGNHNNELYIKGVEEKIIKFLE